MKCPKCPKCGESKWVEPWKAAFSDSRGYYCAISRRSKLYGCGHEWTVDEWEVID